MQNGSATVGTANHPTATDIGGSVEIAGRVEGQATKSKGVSGESCNLFYGLGLRCVHQAECHCHDREEIQSLQELLIAAKTRSSHLICSSRKRISPVGRPEDFDRSQSSRQCEGFCIGDTRGLEVKSRAKITCNLLALGKLVTS